MSRFRRLCTALSVPVLVAAGITAVATPSASAVAFFLCEEVTADTPIWATGQIGVHSVATAHAGDIWYPDHNMYVYQDGVRYRPGHENDDWSIAGLVDSRYLVRTQLVCG